MYHLRIVAPQERSDDALGLLKASPSVCNVIFLKGEPSDAVIWEQVEFRTSEESKLSASYLTFIVLATLIAVVGLLLDSPILIVGAMVVGPEFGPIAGVCVALVERQRKLAARSFLALAVGFAAAIALSYRRRRADHLRDEPRRAGGLPIGRSRSSPPEHDPV